MDMGEYEIWAKPMADGKVAVCFLNRTNAAWNLNYDWKKQTMYFVEDVNLRKNTYDVRDVWEHKSIGNTESKLVKNIPAHSVLMVVLSKK
ncbi:Alpha-galactosidase A precursor [compost metagenome]